jgi:hypothetical protein
MIDQLRALSAEMREFADTYNVRHVSQVQVDDWADRIDALLPPPQPPDAYTNIPFVSVAEADKYAKEHTR